jgi:hypothetical protein
MTSSTLKQTPTNPSNTQKALATIVAFSEAEAFCQASNCPEYDQSTRLDPKKRNTGATFYQEIL